MVMLKAVVARLGGLAASCPRVSLIFSLAVASLSLAGFYAIPREVILNLENGFALDNAPSARALAEQISFFRGAGKPWYMGLFAETKYPNSSSMLSTKEFGEMKEFYKNIKKDLVIAEDENGRGLTFLDFCGHTCDLNEPLFKTYTIWEMTSFFLGTKLEWPVTSVMNYKSNIGKHFFLRETDKMTGELNKAQLAAVYFMVFINGTEMEKALERFENSARMAAEQQNAEESTRVRLTVHSAGTMQGEISRGVSVLARYLVAGLLFSLFWTLLGVFLAVGINGRLDGFVLVIFAFCVLLPLFSLLSSFAVASILSLTYNMLFFLTPVVSLALSIDCVLHVFHAFLQHSNEVLFDSHYDQMTHLIGASLNSVLTNLLSFVPLFLGFLLPIESFANVSILLGFIFLFTLFYMIFLLMPLLVLCYPLRTHLPVSTGRPAACTTGVYKSITGCLSTAYTSSSLVKLFTVTLWCLLAALALYGRTMARADLDYRHLLPRGSPAAMGVDIMSDIVWPDILQIIFFVEKPPNFEDPKQFGEFSAMIREMETMPDTLGEDSNMMWMSDYKRYTDASPSADRLNMTVFKNFINDEVYSAWQSGIHYHFDESGRVSVDRMIVMIAFNGTRSPADKARLLTECRKIAVRYPQFDVVPFDTEVATADVLLAIPLVTYTLPFVVIAGLFIWSLLFAENTTVALLASLSTASVYSITLGVSFAARITLDPFTVGILLFLSVLSSRHTLHLLCQFHECSHPKIDGTEKMERALFKNVMPTFFSSTAGAFLLLPTLLSGIVIPANLGLLSLIHLSVGLLHSFLFLPTVLAVLPSSLLGRSCCITRY